MAALSPTAPEVAWPPLGLGGPWMVVYGWGCMLRFRDLWSSFPAALTQQRRISAAEPGARGGGGCCEGAAGCWRGSTTLKVPPRGAAVRRMLHPCCGGRAAGRGRGEGQWLWREGHCGAGGRARGGARVGSKSRCPLARHCRGNQHISALPLRQPHLAHCRSARPGGCSLLAAAGAALAGCSLCPAAGRPALLRALGRAVLQTGVPGGMG